MPRNGEPSRRRLQRAAFELFGERGYDQTTAAEIAGRAGVTERTFFRHFPDKKEVLFAGEAAFREALARAVAEAPSGLSPLAALHWGLRQATQPLEEFRSVAETRRKVIAETPALQERELAKAAALIGGLAEALRRRGVEDREAALAAHMGMAAFVHAMESSAKDATLDVAAHLDRAFEDMPSLTTRDMK